MRQNKAKNSKKKIADLVAYFAKLVDDSDLSQHEIAEHISDDEKDYSQTYISLMRSGRTKIPVYLVPKFATLFGVDKRNFLLMALDAYHPEIHDLVKTYLTDELSDNERILVELWREGSHVEKSKLTKTQKAKVVGTFADM